MNNNVLFELERKQIFLQAKNYIENVTKKKDKILSLREVEFQVFSQFGMDGIIQWLIQHLNLRQSFIEFGVEDYFESQTRFLLQNNNWTGLIFDSCEENIERIKKSPEYWKYDLIAECAFITKDNINDLVERAGFSGEIGLLCIDIDGNDYWVLEAIDVIRPQVVICEYNAVFGCDYCLSIPYRYDFDKMKAHYSCLYWGASIGAFKHWAERKGYTFFGCDSAGNDAVFVKNGLFQESILPLDRNEFVPSKYRESRNIDGTLSYLRGVDRLKKIQEMPLVDLINMEEKTIKEIFDL